jgi:hypothetical protein
MPVRMQKCKDARVVRARWYDCIPNATQGFMLVQRIAAIVIVVLSTCVVLSAAGATIKNGVVPKNQIASVTPYLGDYEGQWNSSVTDDTSDGISRYKLENPVMRLSLDAANQLHVQFFMDRASADANDELDLLGFGCRSKVGDLLELETKKPPKPVGEEPYQVLAARLDFDWGNCPARVYAVPSNDLLLALLIDPTQKQYIVQLRLLKRVQADGKIVVDDNGVQRVVKVRPKAGDSSMYDPKMEYCVLNEFGEVEKCFDQETELKRYIVPFPFPGLSAVWFTKKTPDLKVVPGVKKTYHEAVFHRPIDAPQ